MLPIAEHQVTVRGPIPHDLGKRIAQAHAAAIKATTKRKGTLAKVPLQEEADATGHPTAPV